MSRSKKLLRDIFLFALASFVPKMLSFFLVPLYTSLLTTSDYGTADLLSTIYSLLLPVLTLDVSDAIMIYTVEAKRDNENVEEPLRIGNRVLKYSSLGLLIILFLVVAIIHTSKIPIYCAYVWIQYTINAYYNNLIAYLRGKDHVNIIVQGSIISSFVAIVGNILFVLVLRLGLNGYLLGSIVGPFAADIYVTILIKHIDHLSFFSSDNDKSLTRKMLTYSIPLIFTGIAWWVNGSSDRIFISLLAGVSLNGIYAVANKIPSILNAVHSIIYQAMQLSVFSEIHSEDNKQYLNRLYNIYNTVMILSGSLLIVLDKWLADLLFKKDFYVAWKYVPGLLISTVLFSVSGYVTTIDAATKDTKLIARATVTGAIVNTILNILLIKPFQIFGAVAATVIGYFIIWCMILKGTMKQANIHFDVVKSCIMYALMIVQWIIINILDFYLIPEIVILIVLFVMNINYVKDVFSIGVNVLKKKK